LDAFHEFVSCINVHTSCLVAEALQGGAAAAAHITRLLRLLPPPDPDAAAGTAGTWGPLNGSAAAGDGCKYAMITVRELDGGSELQYLCEQAKPA